MAFAVSYYIIAVTDVTERRFGVVKLFCWHCSHRGLSVKSTDTKESELGKRGNRRFSCVTFVAFRVMPIPRLSGLGGHEPGGTLPVANHHCARSSFFNLTKTLPLTVAYPGSPLELQPPPPTQPK